MVKRLVLAIAVAVFAAGAPAHAGVGADDLCKEAKNKAAGKKAFDLLKAFGKNTKKYDIAKLAQDISKAQSKFTKGFSKADAQGPCPFPGDEANVEPVVDDCVSDVIDMIVWGSLRTTLPRTGQTAHYDADKNDGIPGPVYVGDEWFNMAGAPLGYVDNGDGTITDVNTGLMWEKKSDDGGLHDMGNEYVWSGTGSEETIWDWLDDVNNEGGSGFAGYQDWRVPNVRELQSIVNYGVAYPGPVVSPEFDTACTPGCTVTTCSCTASYWYWSSTTFADTPDVAWLVDFGDGSVDSSCKSFAFTSVRFVAAYGRPFDSLTP